jgi:hypothetical protein
MSRFEAFTCRLYVASKMLHTKKQRRRPKMISKQACFATLGVVSLAPEASCLCCWLLLLCRQVQLVLGHVHVCYAFPMLGSTLLKHEDALVEQYGRQRFDEAVEASGVYNWATAELLHLVSGDIGSAAA